MEYEELSKNFKELSESYSELLEENKRLKNENGILKRQLELSVQPFKPDEFVQTDEAALSAESGKSADESEGKGSVAATQYKASGPISNLSSPQNKIDLFMSLFRGREDAYAKRWQSKDGRAGYAPVCLNEWAKGICEKPRVKCADCGNKNYAVWDSEAVDKHLRGNAVFGIYPMLADETCYFLVMDFDKECWEQDVSTLRQSCIEKDVPIAVERSRSGNGAHVWFFFTDKCLFLKTP